MSCIYWCLLRITHAHEVRAPFVRTVRTHRSYASLVRIARTVAHAHRSCASLVRTAHAQAALAQPPSCPGRRIHGLIRAPFREPLSQSGKKGVKSGM